MHVADRTIKNDREEKQRERDKKRQEQDMKRGSGANDTRRKNLEEKIKSNPLHDKDLPKLLFELSEVLTVLIENRTDWVERHKTSLNEARKSLEGREKEKRDIELQISKYKFDNHDALLEARKNVGIIDTDIKFLEEDIKEYEKKLKGTMRHLREFMFRKRQVLGQLRDMKIEAQQQTIFIPEADGQTFLPIDMLYKPMQREKISDILKDAKSLSHEDCKKIIENFDVYNTDHWIDLYGILTQLKIPHITAQKIFNQAYYIQELSADKIYMDKWQCDHSSEQQVFKCPMKNSLDEKGFVEFAADILEYEGKNQMHALLASIQDRKIKFGVVECILAFPREVIKPSKTTNAHNSEHYITYPKEKVLAILENQYGEILRDFCRSCLTDNVVSRIFNDRAHDKSLSYAQ